MLRYVIPALALPTTCFAAIPDTASQLGLDPSLVAGMSILICAQVAVVHLRSSWEKQLSSIRT